MQDAVQELPLDDKPLEPIGDYGTIEYRLRKRLKKVRESLTRLTAATGMLPAEESGTVQGREFNAAYREAIHVLQEEQLEPNY
jgi:hypothetical protein